MNTYKPKHLLPCFLMTFVGFFSYATERQVCSAGANANKALMIIDMQADYIRQRLDSTQWGEHAQSNRQGIRNVIDEQIAAINAAKAANIHIIFISIRPYQLSPHIDLVQAVGNYPHTRTFFKSTQGAFDHWRPDEDNYEDRVQIIQYLQNNNIGSLIFMGINGRACVVATFTGARAGGCNVILYNPGIASITEEAFEAPYYPEFGTWITNFTREYDSSDYGQLSEINSRNAL